MDSCKSSLNALGAYPVARRDARSLAGSSNDVDDSSSGSRICVRTYSAYGTPETRATISPSN